jgi:DNA-directed RNA polymerase subunit omega
MDAKKIARIEKLIEKVGGRYRLTVLIQKRMRELNRNSPSLVDLNNASPMDIVLTEIENDMISLVSEEEYRKYIRKQLGDDEEEGTKKKTKSRKK